jgi:hypothetical protein
MSNPEPKRGSIPLQQILSELRTVHDAVNDLVSALGELTEEDYRPHGVAMASTAHRRRPDAIGVQLYLGRQDTMDDPQDPTASPYWVDDNGCLHHDDGSLHIRICPRQ